MPRANKILYHSISSVTCLLLLAAAASSQVNVTTYHNDNARTGQNTKETILTPLNVNPAFFGKLFSRPVDSFIYAQPLYLSNVAIPNKGSHNVVYVVTQHDSVYAFDADRNVGTNAAPLWHVSFINPAAGIRTLNYKDTSCGDIPPEIGIMGTPVINIVTGTLYLVARTKENGVYFQRLHALDVTSGAEKFGGPVIIQATVTGTGSGSSGNQIAFDPLKENQRAGLLLQNNLVYIAWGSQCDIDPFHGWLMAYDANTLQQRAVWISTPDGSEGAIWQSGAAPATDSAGNIYFATGNGTFDLDVEGSDYGNTIVKLAPMSKGEFTVADYFTPYNQASLNADDRDLGSGGPILFSNLSLNALHPNLLVQIGKEGTLYLIDRDNMGHHNPLGDTQILQAIPNAISGRGAWTTPAWWNTNLYLGGSGDHLKALVFHQATGLFSTILASQSPSTFNFPGSTPSISVNGVTHGIVWALQEDAYVTKGPAILHAYDATNLANELFNSSQNIRRDNPGSAVKFAVPTIANGKVYVGAAMRLSVYGLRTPTSAESAAGETTRNTATLIREH